MLNELFAREILETCLTLNILQAFDDGVAVYHAASETDPEQYPSGWYIDSKDEVVHAIATDPEAIRELKPLLVEEGYQFDEREAFWENFLGNTAPKLRLPVKVSYPRKKNYHD